jgi:AraC-like DNA-binding protein/CheY-like chemotaxis protein
MLTVSGLCFLSTPVLAVDMISSTEVNLASPPWSGWWAILSCALLAGIVLYLMVMAGFDRVRIRREARLHRMAREKEIELAKSKYLFFTNLSDEFQTPLSRILEALEGVVSSPDAPLNLKSNLSQAYRDASNLMQSVSQFIDPGDSTETGKHSVTIKNGDIDARGHKHVVIDHIPGKRELLVVEDDDEVRNLLVAEFAFEYSVTEAVTGEDGFTIACEKVPDLIISDVALPGKCGVSLCKDIRADFRTSQIPVILLSAKSSFEDSYAEIESVADVYMPKPFNLRCLKAQVRQTIIAKKRLYSSYSQEACLIPANLTDNATDKEFLQKAVDYIDRNLCNPQLSVESIADVFHISRSQVYRKIKALTGQTVVEFIRTIRLKNALKLMEEKKGNLSEIADQSGFNSLSYFTRTFKDQYGKAPSEYMEGIRSNF